MIEDRAQIDENTMIQTTRGLNAEVKQREDFGQAEEYFLEILSWPCRYLPVSSALWLL